MDDNESVSQYSGNTQPQSDNVEQPEQTETVVYTEQLNQLIEAQQVQIAVSLVFVGIFLVSLIVSVFNRYL